MDSSNDWFDLKNNINMNKTGKAFMFAFRQGSTIYTVYVFSEVDAKWDPQQYKAQPRSIENYAPGASSLAARDRSVSGGHSRANEQGSY